MGEHNKKGNIPYWARNQQIIKPKMIPMNAPPQVMASTDIKISDKAISFVGPASDCCVDKVIKEYVPYFEKEGYQIIFTLGKGMQDIIRYVPRWVVLFRLGTNPGFHQELGMGNAVRIIQHLKRLGVRVVYYLDDFLVATNQNAPIQLASQCDAVLVATTELKNFFKSLSNFSVPIIHVPTHVNLPVFDFVPKLDYIESIPIYKVLITSGGRVGALLTHDMCQKANERWEEFDDVEWIINSAGVAQMRTLINAFRNLHKTYIDWIPIETYYRLCKSVDLILHPASKEDLVNIVPPAWQDTWLNSKSAVKYTMAGAASIPIISSPSLSYVESIKEGETGYIVKTADEFLDKILYLKNNSEVADKIGKQARQDIEENYDIRKRYSLYRDAITGAFIEKDNSIGILTSSSDGGPGSFSNILRKYIPKLTDKKYKVVDQDSPAVKHVISVAFLNAEIMRAAKIRDPKVQWIQRQDGLPFVSYLGDETGLQPGEIQTSVLEAMKDNYKLADLIIWQSEWARQQWKSYVDIEKKYKIIYNGVDTEIFNTKSPVIPLPGKTTKILVNNWSIFPHKRVDLAIDAVKKYPNIEFYFVGNFYTLDTAKTMQEFLQYQNLVYYGPIKQQKQLVNLYRSVDALLFTSEHEGCPNTILESAACGCPIIYNKKCSVVSEMFGEDLALGFNTIDDLDYIFNIQLNDIEFIQSIRKGMQLKIQEFDANKIVKNYMEVING